MKVKELIEKLQTLDQEMEVFIDGYEYGVERLCEEGISVKKITLNWQDGEYGGKHEADAWYQRDDCPEVVNGVYLERGFEK